MSDSRCPDLQQLRAYRNGELAGPILEQVAAHVSSCRGCQGRLALPETEYLVVGGHAVEAATVGLEAATDGVEAVTVGVEPSLPTLPGYQLLNEVGRGGMGVVYRAWDVRLKREVAVKLLRDGVAAGGLAAERFRGEAQITGQLQHPGIPAVHELGELSDGRPFLAMKLVKGRTLHELLQERAEPSQERGRFIAIFEQVCHAVGCAHAHNVIHRDLKPANVMVGAHGEVQVMDWGLAKVLDRRYEPDGADRRDKPGQLAPTLTGVTAIETPGRNDSATMTGSMLGTPAYMPPEQAAGEIGKLDARSDVFGLGAILCQILTGRPPYEGKDNHERLVKAMRGDLHEAFARLEACGAEREVVALCKRCLAFRQEDRPANGEAVAEEIAQIRQAAEERAREAELARARAEVAAAEQRKRRRVWIGLAASLLVGLVASLAFAAWAVRAERIATAERDAKERNLAYAKKGNELLGSVFSGLDPKAEYATVAEFRNVLKTNLGKVIQELEGEAVGDALTVADMQNTLGQSLLGLGDFEQAIRLLEKSRQTRGAALGPDHPDTLTSMNNLAEAYRAVGRLQEALPLLEETLRLRRAKLGRDHPQTLTSMNNLAAGYHRAGRLDAALPLLEETLRLRRAKLGPDHPDTLASMNNLAAGYHRAGRLDAALPLYEETLRLLTAKLGPDHPDTLTSMNNLAAGYHRAGRLDAALPLYEETLRLRMAKLGPDHPDTLVSMNSLAAGYQAAGRLDEALPLLEETLRLRMAKLGPDHPETLASMNSLALGYHHAGRLDEALPLYEETLRLVKAKLGPDHPQTLTSMNNLAMGYQATGRVDEALPLLEETLRLAKAKLGPDHPDTLLSMNNLALAYKATGRLEQALPLYEETLRLKKARLGPDHPDTLQSMNNLAGAYQAGGRQDEALRLLEETLRLRKAKLGADHPDTLQSMSNLAGAYQAGGRLDEALPLLEETLQLVKAKLGPDHPQTLQCMNNLALGYHDAGRLDEALPLLEETLRLRKAKLGADHPDTLQSMNNLAGAYQAGGRLDEALPLFQEAAERMEKRGFQHEYAGRILGNLIDCHELLGQFDQAEVWRRKWLAVVKERAGNDSPTYAAELAALGLNLLQQQKWTDAEVVLRECLAIRQKQQPDVWTTFNAQSLLGGALLGRAQGATDAGERAKLLAEAEPLLLQGYEGMKARQQTIPPQAVRRIGEALDRLVQLYTALGQPEQAQKYAELRAK